MPNNVTPTTPSAWVAAVVQAFERAAATYVQSFLVALVGSTFFDQIDWSLATSLAVAAIPTAITVLVAFVGDLSESAHWPPLAQGVFRVARTWAATFLGFLGAAALAAVKAELATFVGNRESTALVPKRYDYDFALAA